jgi:hypothetical protein
VGGGDGHGSRRHLGRTALLYLAPMRATHCGASPAIASALRDGRKLAFAASRMTCARPVFRRPRVRGDGVRDRPRAAALLRDRPPRERSLGLHFLQLDSRLLQG